MKTKMLVGVFGAVDATIVPESLFSNLLVNSVGTGTCAIFFALIAPRIFFYSAAITLLPIHRPHESSIAKFVPVWLSVNPMVPPNGTQELRPPFLVDKSNN